MSDGNDELKTYRIPVRSEDDAGPSAEPPAAAAGEEEPVILSIDGEPAGDAAGDEIRFESEPTVEATVPRSKFAELAREQVRLEEEVRRLQGELYNERARAQAAEARAKEREEQQLRAQADFQNVRRRLEREREESSRYAHSDLLMDIFPALDNFDRALLVAPRPEGLKEYCDGLVLIRKQLREALEKHGVQALEAVGQPFDPNQHEAVTRVAHAEIPVDHVVLELQRGYQYKDRLLRPALVAVSAGPGEDGSGATPPAVDAAGEGGGGES